MSSDHTVKNPIVCAELAAFVITVKPVGPNVGQREAPIIDRDVKGLFELAGDNLKGLVIDLSDVTFMSSMGMGTCIALRNQAMAAGAKVALHGLNDDLLALFKMMRFHKMFDMQKNAQTLEKWMKKL